MPKILKEENEEIFVEMPSGEVTVISKKDEWILEVFPVWAITGSTSRYVFAERSFKTEYSTVRERVYLHRLIVKPKGKENVDHMDRDRLNNRRSNLRICNQKQNAANTGPKGEIKYKGVHKDNKRKLTKPYASYFSYVDAKSRGQTKRKYLGRFETPGEAARAYDKEARNIWGEFAYLNFPEDFKD